MLQLVYALQHTLGQVMKSCTARKDLSWKQTQLSNSVHAASPTSRRSRVCSLFFGEVGGA